MASNFQQMEAYFRTEEMEPAKFPSKFSRANIDSIVSFEFQLGDRSYSLESYLDSTHTDGFLVLKDGRILHESYYFGQRDTTTHISWSISKSLISGMIGILVDRGMIESIMDPVDKYVPELSTSAYKGVTIQQILLMSSGVGFNEDYADYNSDINRFGRVFALGKSMKEFILSLKRERDPGTYNHYVSMDTQVLGWLIESVSGLSLADFCEKNLWQPMGAEFPARWIVDSEGMGAAFGGLNATLRDYARFGQLFCNFGKHGVTQVIDSSWIQASIDIKSAIYEPGDHPFSSNPFGYGYQWWIPFKDHAMYAAFGIYNQYIIIDPTTKIVIVKLSSYGRFKDAKYVTHDEHLSFFRQLIDFIS